MQVVDADRLCWVAEHAYAVELRSLVPLSCSPKNNLIVGWPLENLQSTCIPQSVPAFTLEECCAVRASSIESEVAEAAEAAVLLATSQISIPDQGASVRSVDDSNRPRGKNGGIKLGRPALS